MNAFIEAQKRLVASSFFFLPMNVTFENMLTNFPNYFDVWFLNIL